MDQLESTTYSFILRVWLEDTSEHAAERVWRGHITHVPSNERRYIRSLDDIVTAVIELIQNLDVRHPRT